MKRRVLSLLLTAVLVLSLGVWAAAEPSPAAPEEETVSAAEPEPTAEPLPDEPEEEAIPTPEPTAMAEPSPAEPEEETVPTAEPLATAEPSPAAPEEEAIPTAEPGPTADIMPAAEPAASGNCGLNGYGDQPCSDNVKWSYAGGVLTVYGRGSMGDFWSVSKVKPWEPYVGEITEIVIQDGVTNIGKGAFYQHTNLRKVTIADSVTWITCFAFNECRSLTSVRIPDRVTGIGHYVFENCVSLTDVTIPSGLRTFGTDDFYNTPWLRAQGDCVVVNQTLLACQGASEDITAPDGVVTVNEGALSHCETLRSITLPASVQIIEEDAMACPSLQQIHVAAANPAYSAADGVLYDKSGSTLLVYPGGRNDMFTVPAGVTTIGDSAFYHGRLTGIVMPDTVTAVGDSAFLGCAALRLVTLSGNLRSIGYRMFYGCASLTALTIPSSVDSIGWGAFIECTGLTSVTIPATVGSIDENAFYRCYRLTAVTIENPVCSIYSKGDTLGVPGTTVIRGASGSTAEAYAKAYGYTFFDLSARCDHPDRRSSVTAWPDCTEAGVNAVVCVVCGERWSETVPPLGHGWSGRMLQEPTVDTDGQVRLWCWRCDASLTAVVCCPRNLFSYLCGGGADAVEAAANDVNADGSVDLKDATRLYQYIRYGYGLCY